VAEEIGAALKPGDDSPVIKHRRRGKTDTWCGEPKADDERWATAWEFTTCPACHDAKRDQENEPPPAPADLVLPNDTHQHFGAVIGKGAQWAIERGLDNRGRNPLPPEATPTLDQWGTSVAFLLDHYGLLEQMAGPWGVFAVATADLAIVVVKTGEKPHEPEPRVLSDPSGEDSGRRTGDRQNVVVPPNGAPPAESAVV